MKMGTQQVRLENEELCSIDKFRYLGYVMTADCRDDKDIKREFRSKNAAGNMLVRKFSFTPTECKWV